MAGNLITSERPAARIVWAAFLASLAVPGLGHMYCGRLSRGSVYAAALILAALLAPLGLVLKPEEPSLRRAVLLAALYASILIVCHIDAVLSARVKDRFTRKRYNTWWAYAIFGVLSLTLQSGALFAVASFYSTARIDGDFMEPSFRQGERALLAQPRGRAWKPGDAVAFTSGGIVKHGRIIGGPGDRVARTKGRLEVNGVPLSLGIFNDRDLARRGIDNPENIFYEVSGVRKYSISETLDKSVSPGGDSAEITVEKSSVLIAFDNRAEHPDLVSTGIDTIRGRLDGVLRPVSWRRILLLSHYPL